MSSKETTEIKAYSSGAEVAKIKDNEVFLKMNYLFQISQLMKPECLELANFYLKEFGLNAQKRVVRVDKEVSKDYCRKCLKYYDKQKYAIERNNDKVFLLKKCLQCKKERKQFLSATSSSQHKKSSVEMLESPTNKIQIEEEEQQQQQGASQNNIQNEVEQSNTSM